MMVGMNLPYTLKDCEQDKKGAVYLNTTILLKNLTCSQVWTYESGSSCKCGSTVYGAVSCNTVNQVTSILNCNCMTFSDDETGVLVGECPYRCGFSQINSTWSRHVYYSLPSNVTHLNDAMCGRLNRDGRLCGKCKKGFSPQVYSYDPNCIKCTSSQYNWLKFTAIAFIPLTVFYFIVIVFRINATNPYLYGFITLNQVLASPMFMRGCFLTTKGNYKLAVRLLAIPYMIWNLEFFRSLSLNICLDLTTLQTLALDYAIAVYPLVLVVITYTVIELHARGCRVLVWLWRPFHRCCVRFTRIMDIQSSIVKAFATFLLLSYVKLLNATVDILLPTVAYNVHEDVIGWYVYYDASYKYFRKEHLPYAIMSIFIFILFVLSPLLLLLFYPVSCFQKYCCRHRIYSIHTFVDSFQGHYKDGTEPGTRDCRWFAAAYFLGRIIMLYVFFGLSKNILSYAFIALGMICFGILMILLQPYRKYLSYDRSIYCGSC